MFTNALQRNNSSSQTAFNYSQIMFQVCLSFSLVQRSIDQIQVDECHNRMSEQLVKGKTGPPSSIEETIPLDSVEESLDNLSSSVDVPCPKALFCCLSFLRSLQVVKAKCSYTTTTITLSYFQPISSRPLQSQQPCKDNPHRILIMILSRPYQPWSKNYTFLAQKFISLSTQ